MENVKKGITRVNLHTHTTNSDGKATIESLLDQSAAYGDKLAKIYPNSPIPPFTLALTNHDAIDDSKTAIKIIAANPDKYKNMRFVAGIEFSTKFTDDNTLFKPGTKLEMETIGYCINPFDKKLNEFVENRHKSNSIYAKALFTEVNNWMQSFKFDLDKLKNDNVYLKMQGSPAFPEELLKSVKETFEKEIKEVSKKHINNAGDQRLTSFTPEVKEVANLLKQTGYGELGLAHPGRIEKLYSSLASAKMAGEKGMALFLDKIKKQGVAVIETEYQYPADYKGDYSSKESFDSSIKNIRETSDSIGLLKAGGIDTHSINLFLNKDKKIKSE